jgi:hypothetical protein
LVATDNPVKVLSLRAVRVSASRPKKARDHDAIVVHKRFSFVLPRLLSRHASRRAQGALLTRPGLYFGEGTQARLEGGVQKNQKPAGRSCGADAVPESNGAGNGDPWTQHREWVHLGTGRLPGDSPSNRTASLTRSRDRALGRTVDQEIAGPWQAAVIAMVGRRAIEGGNGPASAFGIAIDVGDFGPRRRSAFLRIWCEVR